MIISAVKTPDQSPLDPTDEEIALCAYRIWLHEGCPQGRDRAHWLKAREQLLAGRGKEKSAADIPIRNSRRGTPGAP
ncbi:MAG: DUF2934 domain-containing protein [Verrucomicrobiae bacterium]